MKRLKRTKTEIAPAVPSSTADEARRAKLKTAATLRAQFNYEVAMRRIDYKLDVIEPELQRVVQEIATVGHVPDFAIPEVSGDSEDPADLS